jgi:signal transduction histidine kinase
VTTGPAMTEPQSRRWPPAVSSIRTRMLAASVVLLAVSMVGAVFFMRQILLVQLEDDINAGIAREYREFKALVGGRDPRTGRPFGDDLKAIFDVFFARNIPEEGEVFLAFVNGRPYEEERGAEGLSLQTVPEAIERWAQISDTERGNLETESEIIRYLAIPLRAGDEVRGSFVVAYFPSVERSEIDHAIRVGAAVTIGVLAIASVLAWFIVGRLLAPLQDLAATTQAISETDLSRRIPVRGQDEISLLAGQFNHMLDRLEAAFRTQRQFIADASHELRTPITIIRGHLEVLGDDPEERRETMALVLDEIDRMGRMVEELFVLARAEQPDWLHLEPVDIAALTEDLQTKARALGERRWKLDSMGRGIMIADRQRLTQAVVQLAQNAVQYTNGDDEIALGSSASDGRVQFWVRDTGPGIPTGEQERIFDRFARGSRGSRRSGGTGVGLAIVRAIAEAHHGQVSVHSHPGAGATFTIDLPTDQPQNESRELRH